MPGTPSTPPVKVDDVEIIAETERDTAPDLGEVDIEEDLESFEPEDGDNELFDPMQQLSQFLVTESGVPIVDVLQGIQEALDKQNKILYKLVSVVESKTG